MRTHVGRGQVHFPVIAVFAVAAMGLGLALHVPPSKAQDGGAPDIVVPAKPKTQQGDGARQRRGERPARAAPKPQASPKTSTAGASELRKSISPASVADRHKPKKPVLAKNTPPERGRVDEQGVDLAKCAQVGPDGKPSVTATDRFDFKIGLEIGFALFGHAGMKESTPESKPSSGVSTGELQFRWRYIPAISIRGPGNARTEYFPLVSGPEEPRGTASVFVSCTPFVEDRKFASQALTLNVASLPILTVRFRGLDPTLNSDMTFLPSDIRTMRDVTVGQLKLVAFTSLIQSEDDLRAVTDMLRGGLGGLWSAIARYSRLNDEPLQAPWLCTLTDNSKIKMCGQEASADDARKGVRVPRSDVTIEIEDEDNSRRRATLRSSSKPSEIQTPSLLSLYKPGGARAETAEPGTQPDPTGLPVPTADPTGLPPAETGTPSEVQAGRRTDPSRPQDEIAEVIDENSFISLCETHFEGAAARKERHECIRTRGANLPPDAQGTRKDGTARAIVEIGPDGVDGPSGGATEVARADPAPVVELLPVRVDPRVDADARVAFFQDMATCEDSIVAGARLPAVVLAQAQSQRRETVAVLLDRDGGPASACTAAEVAESGDVGEMLTFPFAAFRPAGPGSAYVVSLAAGFQELGIDSVVRDALRDAIQSAVESGHAASLLTIDGNREVRTVLSAKDVRMAAGLSAERRRQLLNREVGKSMFVVRSMQPLADTAPIYRALRGREVGRIYYIVDSRRENFDGPDAGAVFAWLVWDDIPVNVLSIGGCGEWEEKFAEVGAGLTCVDLEQFSSDSKDNILAALLPQAQQ